MRLLELARVGQVVSWCHLVPHGVINAGFLPEPLLDLSVLAVPVLVILI